MAYWRKGRKRERKCSFSTALMRLEKTGLCQAPLWRLGSESVHICGPTQVPFMTLFCSLQATAHILHREKSDVQLLFFLSALHYHAGKTLCTAVCSTIIHVYFTYWYTYTKSKQVTNKHPFHPSAPSSPLSRHLQSLKMLKVRRTEGFHTHRGTRGRGVRHVRLPGCRRIGQLPCHRR